MARTVEAYPRRGTPIEALEGNGLSSPSGLSDGGVFGLESFFLGAPRGGDGSGSSGVGPLPGAPCDGGGGGDPPPASSGGEAVPGGGAPTGGSLGSDSLVGAGASGPVPGALGGGGDCGPGVELPLGMHS